MLDERLNAPAMWVGEPGAATPDTHVEFRGTFSLDRNQEVELRLLTTVPALVWLDGDLVLEGPLRFPPAYPEYLHRPVTLTSGSHEVRIRAVYEGITTRIMEKMPPLVACEIPGAVLTWKGTPLNGFAREARRINPQLGWIEWWDTRESTEAWEAPHTTALPWPLVSRAAVSPPSLVSHALHAYSEGPLAERYGYANDDPAARFFLRDIECHELPRGGTWRRYDLDRVRLGRPRFLLDLPAGAIVEFAGCEELAHGRVQPWITLSAGASCNLDHYVAKGGRQVFMPVVPKGMRYLEAHILAPPEQIRFLREEFVEKTYYGVPDGAFESDDTLLNRIWSAGIETFRACTEDSLIDNPTRERGQWTGDVVTVGMDIASVAYTDLSPIRRALVMSAHCAREDGLIAGLCPGGPAFLSTYAAQWISACVHYLELTGDRQLLVELFPFAERNLAAFEAHLTPDGLGDDLGWAFIDWGYVRNEGPSDMGLNFHYLLSLRDMVRWCQAIERPTEAKRYSSLALRIEQIVSSWVAELAAPPGLQRSVLALRAGLVGRDRTRAYLEFIKAHYRSCFPNDPHAPRLSDPSAAQARLITPYFSHYALSEMWERGEASFALEQYRHCWKWALEGGRTTLLEVFDTRWSHCHQWSGCPTWQLSRFVSGLRSRFDIGAGVFDFKPQVVDVKHAQIKTPLHIGEHAVTVLYERFGHGGKWRIETPIPIRLRMASGEVKVERSYELTL
ncbi:family 78 glycoside hydrolase catalytic domain [Fimbriimonas ginsengisoli]|uniref:Alpha-L-rhamnosidase n=1 Tax=Fimbriimonas ginsengisoli Gsoil 348 TaxID=661478 RepID=A0A068NXA9_FIMGI|nr:family 78 glycoside hydrolase catalytic domain [Fimbriimonas ginsengisoli]AIE86269.1 alpha-L-rhamnosidase [Fimbriimonas ginsengisoli Gsoil 348]